MPSILVCASSEAQNIWGTPFTQLSSTLQTMFWYEKTFDVLPSKLESRDPVALLTHVADEKWNQSLLSFLEWWQDSPQYSRPLYIYMPTRIDDFYAKGGDTKRDVHIANNEGMLRGYLRMNLRSVS